MGRFCACLVALGIMSCVSDQIDDICGEEHEADKYHITVEVELPQYAAASRSSFLDKDLGRITDLNICDKLEQKE